MATLPAKRISAASSFVAPQRSGAVGCVFTQQLTVESLGVHGACARVTGAGLVWACAV